MTSRPAGADVIVDDQLRGSTPVALALQPGDHSMTVRLGDVERVVPITVAAGSELTQYLELTGPERSLPQAGQISVATDPPGARVAIDGQFRGVSPLNIRDVPAASHRVSVTSGAGSAERIVAVERGGTTSVVFALTSASPPPFGAGWLTVAAPFDVQLLERGEVIGSSEAVKIMMPAGRHDVLVVNRALGYESRRQVDIVDGKVATVRIEAPRAALSVNARPWADVVLDVEPIGQTPIANLPVSIGTHVLLFTHPQFGERRQTIVVTSTGPNRVAVDLTK